MPAGSGHDPSVVGKPSIVPNGPDSPAPPPLGHRSDRVARTGLPIEATPMATISMAWARSPTDGVMWPSRQGRSAPDRADPAQPARPDARSAKANARHPGVTADRGAGSRSIRAHARPAGSDPDGDHRRNCGREPLVVWPREDRPVVGHDPRPNVDHVGPRGDTGRCLQRRPRGRADGPPMDGHAAPAQPVPAQSVVGVLVLHAQGRGDGHRLKGADGRGARLDGQA